MPEGIQEYRTSIAPPQSSRKPRHHEMRRKKIVDFVSTDPTKPKTKKEICEHLRSTDQFKDTKEDTLSADLRKLVKEGSGPLVPVGTATSGPNRGWILRGYESDGQAFFEGGEKQQRKPRLVPNPSPTPSQKGKTQMKSSQTFKSLMWGRKEANGGLILAVMYAEDGNNGEPVDAEKVLKQISKSGLGDEVVESYQNGSKAAIEKVQKSLLYFCLQKKKPDVENTGGKGDSDRSLFKLSKHLPQHL